MITRVTHTLMESCCVEEFLLSAEEEGIWGFTRAMETVGGVSLVIFFSLWNKIHNYYMEGGRMARRLSLIRKSNL